MGYTHYWEKIGPINEAQYKAALTDILNIVGVKRNILANGHGEAGTLPDLIGNHFQFNGIEEASHETFSLPIDPRGVQDFDFCKTARKPYDVVVVACLARLAEVEGIKVASDGDQEDWVAGVALATEILGRKVKVPKSIE